MSNRLLSVVLGKALGVLTETKLLSATCCFRDNTPDCGDQHKSGMGLPSLEAEDIDKRAYLVPRMMDTAKRAVGLAPQSLRAHFALFFAYAPRASLSGCVSKLGRSRRSTRTMWKAS